MSGLIYLKAFHALGGLSETFFMLLYCARFCYLKVSDNISAFISGRQNQDKAGEMFLLKWKQKGPSNSRLFIFYFLNKTVCCGSWLGKKQH